MDWQTPDFVTWDELCSWDAPTHWMKTWSGLIDPLNPTIHDTLKSDLENRTIHEEDFGLLGRIRNVRQFVDIGANCGQSIVSYRALNSHTPIVSFEPNPLCFRTLCAFGGTLPNVRAYPFGLSSNDAFLELYTPVVDRLLVTPLATTMPDYYRTGAGVEWLKKHYDGHRVAIYAERLAFQHGDAFGLTPGIIKIDVEGAELAVVQGLANTIRDYRPLIMAENSRAMEVVNYLSGLNYEPWQWLNGALCKIDITNWDRWGAGPLNVIYAHVDRIDELAAENELTLRVA